MLMLVLVIDGVGRQIGSKHSTPNTQRPTLNAQLRKSARALRMGWWMISSTVWNGVPRCKWEGSLGALRQPPNAQ